MYDVLSSRKKKLKRLPSLKFRRLKSEIFRPPLLEIGPSWARYFRSGISTSDVIFLTRDWFSFDRHWYQSGFYLRISEISVYSEAHLGKVCLKAVGKVALSLQTLASARQVKISNHTMIVPSQIATEEETTQYAEQVALGEEEEP